MIRYKLSHFYGKACVSSFILIVNILMQLSGPKSQIGHVHFLPYFVNQRQLIDRKVVQLVKILVANNPLLGDTLPLATSSLD